MQRSVFMGILVVLVVLGISMIRVPESGDPGYMILFDDMPDIKSEQIYYAGREIGQIRSTDRGARDVIKITAQLDEDFLQEMGNNIAFYPDHGRLTATRLQAIGEPLPKDAILCGFSSKITLGWFKFKTMLENRISAANHRALSLYRKSGLS